MMMKSLRPTFIIALIISAFGTAVAQTDAARPKASDYFLSAPLTVASYLSNNARLDMLDYFNLGMKSMTANNLNEKYAISAMIDRAITYADRDSIATTIVVLPTVKSDTLLLVIHTLREPLYDSQLALFDSRWNPISKPAVPSPTLRDWCNNDMTVYAAAADALPFMASTASYDTATETLTLTPTISSYFVDEDRPQVIERLRPDIKYAWNGKNFKLIKDE